MFKRVLSNISWLLFDKVFRAGLSIVIMGRIAQHLGVAEFGVFNYIISIVAICSAVASLGLPAILIKNLVENKADHSRIIGSALVLRLLGTLVGFTLLIGYAWMTEMEWQVKILLLIFSGKLAFEVFDVLDNYYKSRIESRVSVLSRFLAFLIVSLLKIYLLFNEGTVSLFLAVEASEFMLISVFYIWFYRKGKHDRWRFDATVARRMFKDAFPLFLATAAGMVYMRIDQIMVKELVGEAENGVYAVGVRISELFYFIPAIIGESFFPSLIMKRQQDESHFRGFMQRNFNLLAILAAWIAVAIMLTGPWIVEWLFGVAFERAYPILVVHVWTALFIFLSVQSGKYLVIEGLQRLTFYRTVAGAILNVILNFFLIPVLGGYGAALATLISQAYVCFFSNLLHRQTVFLWKMQLIAYLNILNPLEYYRLYQYVRIKLK